MSVVSYFSADVTIVLVPAHTASVGEIRHRADALLYAALRQDDEGHRVIFETQDATHHPDMNGIGQVMKTVIVQDPSLLAKDPADIKLHDLALELHLGSLRIATATDIPALNHEILTKTTDDTVLLRIVARFRIMIVLILGHQMLNEDIATKIQVVQLTKVAMQVLLIVVHVIIIPVLCHVHAPGHNKATTVSDLDRHLTTIMMVPQENIHLTVAQVIKVVEKANIDMLNMFIYIIL
ncbi:DNA-binding proteins Bright/BRCAA1/rbp1, variant 3 [Schistosoma haematobium]|uniref:DNA-binding proteins Bright/BRCAA1/rbp1, variant 3 n=1 Tax=Schistosoma haematobium TaxID=6185 RepID=A0A922S3Y2_SCHHA|nr:DNA-binding proteins Bright/BRCAA1/rbp1, variant 3 [Schistosoma haematobium]KAH9592402.1 DNA-binding proteins Bright/BRCAA1/rbp1, variant 3 [Schistosoma haematobium]